MDEIEQQPPLQATTSALIARIEENQRILQRYHRAEALLLGCTGLAELLQALLLEIRHLFDLDTISLVIHDPDYSVGDLLDYLDISRFDGCLQLVAGEETIKSVYGQLAGPQQSPWASTGLTVSLGPWICGSASQLFHGWHTIGSVALLPLERKTRLLGSLHLGSHSPDRFSADKATDFMRHLALIVGVCLENCIAREQLRRQGQVDMLTQVRNRRSFEEEFVRELARAERNGEALSCMFIDVDHFKRINDTYGHQAGDLCLKAVAQRVQAQLRKTDLLARYGGEEFVVLLPRCLAPEAVRTAERIRLALEAEPVVVDSLVLEQTTAAGCGEIAISASLGVSCWQASDGRSGDLAGLGAKLLQAADSAMYDAKQAGRNLVCLRDFFPGD